MSQNNQPDPKRLRSLLAYPDACVVFQEFLADRKRYLAAVGSDLAVSAIRQAQPVNNAAEVIGRAIEADYLLQCLTEVMKV
jgi:hypothetical protein